MVWVAHFSCANHLPYLVVLMFYQGQNFLTKLLINVKTSNNVLIITDLLTNLLTLNQSGDAIQIVFVSTLICKNIRKKRGRVGKVKGGGVTRLMIDEGSFCTGCHLSHKTPQHSHRLPPCSYSLKTITISEFGAHIDKLLKLRNKKLQFGCF